MFKKIFVTFCCISSLLMSIAAYSLPTSIISMFVSPNSKACGLSAAAYIPGFCTSFRTVAFCRCQSDSPIGCTASTMAQLYAQMTAFFGSQSAACAYQKQDSYQDCMDKWNCYRGLTPDNAHVVKTDSAGRLCSGTGLSCPPG